MRGARLFSFIFLLILSACTVVRIDGGQATVHAGTLRLVAPQDAEIIAIRSRGLGIVNGVRNHTIGYQEEVAVVKMAANSCAIIIFNTNLDENGQRFWREIAKDREDICQK